MTTQELRVVVVLASIFALRMLGLCMLLPVFALEARHFTGSTAQLIGVAVGVYGLFQALLQVPFGMLSDRFGRKPLIVAGLLFILLGSLIAARSSSIYGLIIGRALQGCGAIGSVVIATLADYTREQVRTSAMAILGASIGAAFVLALILGPWLNQAFGLASIFAVTGFFAAGCIILLIGIPKPSMLHQSSTPALSGNVQLVNLNVGAFVLHASLAGLFLVLPILMQQRGIESGRVWVIYGVVMILAMLVTWRLIRRSERSVGVEKHQLLAVLGLVLGPLLLYTVDNLFGLICCLFIYFTAFCLLEASLPTMVAKYASSSNRGAAMGMYSTMQFMGVFFGGMMGGWLHSNFGVLAVIGFCILLAASWLIFSVLIRKIEERKIWQEA